MYSYFSLVIIQLPGGDRVLSIRTEEIDPMSDLPVIVKNVTVYSKLTYVMRANGVRLSVGKVSTC